MGLAITINFARQWLVRDQVRLAVKLQLADRERFREELVPNVYFPMSVETKQRTLRFAFFFFFWYGGLGWFFFCFLLFLLQATVWALCSTASVGVPNVMVEQLQASLCFKTRVQWGSSSPGTPGAISQLSFLGKGMGFCCATLPGAGGQAAGAGVSQELSGSGARP